MKELIKRTAQEIIASLPAECWSTLPENPKQLIKIKAGETGYYPINNVPETWLKDKTMQDVANDLNNKAGITGAQVEAMEMGSLFGWEVPAADPLNYEG